MDLEKAVNSGTGVFDHHLLDKRLIAGETADLAKTVDDIYLKHELPFPLGITGREGYASYPAIVEARINPMNEVRKSITEAVATRYGKTSRLATTAEINMALGMPFDKLFHRLITTGAYDVSWQEAAPEESDKLAGVLNHLLSGNQFAPALSNDPLRDSLIYLLEAISTPSPSRLFFEVAAQETYKTENPVIWIAPEPYFLSQLNTRYKSNLEPTIRFFVPLDESPRQLLDNLTISFWNRLLSIYSQAGVGSMNIRNEKIQRSDKMPLIMAGIYLSGAGGDILSSVSAEGALPRAVGFFPNALKHDETVVKLQQIFESTETRIPEILTAILYGPHELGHCYRETRTKEIYELVHDLTSIAVALPMLQTLPPDLREQTLESFLTLMIADYATWYSDDELPYRISSRVLLNQLFNDRVVEISDEAKPRFNLDKIPVFTVNCHALLVDLLKQDSGIEQDTTGLNEVINVRPKEETEKLMKMLF